MPKSTNASPNKPITSSPTPIPVKASWELEAPTEPVSDAPAVAAATVVEVDEVVVEDDDSTVIATESL